MGIIIQQVSKLHEDSDYICFLHCVLVFRVVTGIQYVFGKHLLKECMDEGMNDSLLPRAHVRIK